MSDQLTDLDLATLRARRDEVRSLETAVSYRRRLLQAQLDIVAGLGSDDGQLEERLASVLAERPSAASGPTRAMVTDVGDVDTPTALPDDLRSLSDTERAELVERLMVAERAASDRRRELLDELDELQAELVRRYQRDGVDAARLIGGDG